MYDLDVANTWSFIRPGYESSPRSEQLVRRWGIPRESVPGQCIGNEDSRVGCHWTTRVFKQPHFIMLYIILNSGGFDTSSFRASRKVPSTSTPWSDMCVVQVSTVSNEHVYVTCYFCYMFSLGPSSGETRGQRANWWGS
jgi:hypothetical protein